ncbi:hypothetical protein GCM10009815_38440 [Nocardioides marmoribigeumensis]
MQAETGHARLEGGLQPDRLGELVGVEAGHRGPADDLATVVPEESPVKGSMSVAQPLEHGDAARRRHRGEGLHAISIAARRTIYKRTFEYEPVRFGVDERPSLAR